MGHTDGEKRWNAAIIERMEKRGMDKRQAVRSVCAEEPAIHREYLKSYNQRMKGEEGGAK